MNDFSGLKDMRTFVIEAACVHHCLSVIISDEISAESFLCFSLPNRCPPIQSAVNYLLQLLYTDVIFPVESRHL